MVRPARPAMAPTDKRPLARSRRCEAAHGCRVVRTGISWSCPGEVVAWDYHASGHFVRLAAGAAVMSHDTSERYATPVRGASMKTAPAGTPSACATQPTLPPIVPLQATSPALLLPSVRVGCCFCTHANPTLYPGAAGHALHSAATAALTLILVRPSSSRLSSPSLHPTPLPLQLSARTRASSARARATSASKPAWTCPPATAGCACASCTTSGSPRGAPPPQQQQTPPLACTTPPARRWSCCLPRARTSVWQAQRRGPRRRGSNRRSSSSGWCGRRRTRAK